MGKASTASKAKYNKKSYKRYEFVVGLDKKLNYCLENYSGSVGELVKKQLAKYFEIDVDENFFPFKYAKDGSLIQVDFLDKREET